MRVLVACEYSGTVRDAFIAAGHDAVSCDLLPTDKPGPHIQGDCIPVIKSGNFDIIIMHPPCTALAVSGNRWYGNGMPRNQERIKSINWTLAFWEIAKAHARIGVCMENPVGVLPIKPTQYIQPWQFGHGETKKTGLWLHNLPPLVPTDIVNGREQRIWKMPPSADRAKLRSITYQGIADAMAEQWGDICQD
jgi:site-specific DNA-cytosine methylase